MIVTELYGGLGNQLFQYAMGRALAARRQTSLALDISKMESYKLRTYRLERFAITAQPLSEHERQTLGIRERPVGVLGKLTMKAVGMPYMPLIQERTFSFDPCAVAAPDHCYLRGYWQTPKYFSDFEEGLRVELQLRHAPMGADADVAAKMAKTIPVAVHVRRGDYVSNPHTQRYHGVCGLDYYFAAEKLLRERVGKFQLFIFSDDPSWVQANLRFSSEAHYVSHNRPERDYEDLRLMTMCHHHVIANSTFSWWAAWLCAYPDKVVIAPKQWFREAPLRTDDLIPQNWTRI